MLIIHLQSNLILSFKSRFIVYQSYHTCLCVYHMTQYCPRKYAAAGLSCLRLTDIVNIDIYHAGHRKSLHVYSANANAKLIVWNIRLYQKMVQTGIDFFKASNGYARTWKAAKGNSLYFGVMKMRKNCKNNIITVYKCQSTVVIECPAEAVGRSIGKVVFNIGIYKYFYKIQDINYFLFDFYLIWIYVRREGVKVITSIKLI